MSSRFRESTAKIKHPHVPAIPRIHPAQAGTSVRSAIFKMP